MPCMLVLEQDLGLEKYMFLGYEADVLSRDYACVAVNRMFDDTWICKRYP